MEAADLDVVAGGKDQPEASRCTGDIGGKA
jgi:hypothetical protein